MNSNKLKRSQSIPNMDTIKQLNRHRVEINGKSNTRKRGRSSSTTQNDSISNDNFFYEDDYEDDYEDVSNTNRKIMNSNKLKRSQSIPNKFSRKNSKAIRSQRNTFKNSRAIGIR
jgi:hypothetical protein